MFVMVRIPNSFKAVLIVLCGILGFTLESIIRFEELINFLIVIVCLFIKIFGCSRTILSANVWLARKIQNRSLEMLDTEIILEVPISLLMIITQSICLIPLIMGSMITWFILEKLKIAVVSAKLLEFVAGLLQLLLFVKF